MADSTRLLCLKSAVFILNILFCIFFRPDSTSADSEVLEEYSLSDVTRTVNERCILLALRPSKGDDNLVSILRKLSRAFKNENRAKVGVLKQIDVNLISWEQLKGQDMVEQDDLAFFPRKMEDRSCLLKPSWEKPPKAQPYLGPRTVQELLAFMNKKCQTFRQLDGSLSPTGFAKEKILENLYRVPSSQDPSQLGSNSGPINIASECERIPMPSKQQFFQEYFLRSKPVVITGRMTLQHIYQKTDTKEKLPEILPVNDHLTTFC